MIFFEIVCANRFWHPFQQVFFFAEINFFLFRADLIGYEQEERPAIPFVA
jgi:hypothetical protein